MKKQKPLVIIAVTSLALVIAYLLYDHFRPHCDSIFEQTSTKVGGDLEFIKTKGELFVGREKIQELAEGPQKVALHLKACCVAQQSSKMSPEQTQACINGAKDYESKILQVTTIIREAQSAKDQGNQQLVDQKSAQAKEAVSAASRSVSELGAAAAAITSSPNHPGGPLATEKHTFNVTNYAGTALTVSVNGTWVGQWDANSGTIPLDSVVQGNNELTVELQGQPQNQVTIEVWAQRPAGAVNLLRLNFQGKAPGKYTYFFVAR
ncbi:MAG TPA: hypothetical protein VE263_18010 [Candidatus Angelobacter sp.]|nr:hypothetical protein [Candidatus Angelobacter sp.]